MMFIGVCKWLLLAALLQFDQVARFVQIVDKSGKSWNSK